MSLSAGQIMAIVQAIRWVIRELVALREKSTGELTEEELRVLEEKLRDRIVTATETDRERWDSVIRHLEELENA
jgi:hypothetical protein